METTMMYEAWGWPQWIIAGLYLAALLQVALKKDLEGRTNKAIVLILLVWTLYMGGFWDA